MNRRPPPPRDPEQYPPGHPLAWLCVALAGVAALALLLAASLL